MNRYKIIIFALVIVLVFGAWFYSVRAPQIPPANSGDLNGGAPVVDDEIQVSSLQAGQTIKSPLVVEGKALGNWFFEASFPVKLLDGNGQVIASAPAQAQGEWMTASFVPFRAELSFVSPSTVGGSVVFQNDNPSGLPERVKEFRLPIRFEVGAAKTQAVQLYYYDEAKDKNASGEILCSRQGLSAVSRAIPLTQTPIQDTIKLLLRGELSPAEQARGLSTDYPLAGFSLTGASIKNGVLTLSFNDPGQRTSGGSCRAAILWAQIEATAKQFFGVEEVKFMPTDLFQP